MDHCSRLELGNTSDRPQEQGNQVMWTILGMLSNEVARETASFMVDTSSQLCPEAIRGHPSTPAAATLREYHFTILMRKVVTAYVDGRGQDFADDRFALNALLEEEPAHQPLAARFRRLMGLWLRAAQTKRQKEDFEIEQRRKREKEERQAREEQEREKEKADNMENDGRDEQNDGEEIESSEDGSSLFDAAQQNSDVGDEVQASPAPTRAKSVLDLAGLIDTDEDESSSDDGETSSDEE